MKHPVRICFVLIAGVVLGPSCYPHSTRHPEQEQLRLGVRLYNYARISDEEIRTTEMVVARVLNEAGIQLEWTDCLTNHGTSGSIPSPCDVLAHSTDLILYFVGPLGEHSKWVDYSALGYSIIPDGYELPTTAYVSYLRIQKLSAFTSIDVPEVLGLAVAHEIGHLLLGSNSHANRGIMRAPWKLRDLENRGSELQFTRDQWRQLRAAVQARLRSTR